MRAPKFRKTVLENGATIIGERHEGVNAASIGVWVKVGSTHESKALSGISHAIEHMVFKGTSRRSSFDIATSLESLGGDLNAFTDREVTCYHATVLYEHTEIALDVLSDLALNPQFNKQEFERERKVLLQEHAMVQDSPEEWIHDLHFETVFPKDPIGQPIIGNKKTLQKFTRNDLVKYFENHYHPSNFVIAVTGNVDFDKFVDLSQKHFSHKEKQEKLPLGRRPPKYSARQKRVDSDTDQLHLVVGYEAVPVHDPMRFDMLLLSFFLGGGMSSRLFQEIREKAGLAYSVDCDYMPFSDTGMFSIYAAMAPRSLNECVSILAREVERCATQPLTSEELNLVKGQLKGAILLSSDSMDARQESVARNEILFQRYVSVDEVIKEIESVTPERIQKAAAKIFTKERESIITIGRNQKKIKLRVAP